jgi:hypothetical protein
MILLAAAPCSSSLWPLANKLEIMSGKESASLLDQEAAVESNLAVIDVDSAS